MSDEPARCRCGRTLALLSVHGPYGAASDTPKCPGCGFPAAECPCPPVEAANA